MNNLKSGALLTIVATALLIPIATSAQESNNSALYETMLDLDAAYFDAYTTCNLEAQRLLMDDALEFYHDMGGLSTSKHELINAIEENICGKVTRQLVPESLEVYEIKDFGAVTIGFHRFFNNQEPNAPSKPSRFVTVWKNNDGRWTMYRIISLH